ncbi:S8 family serine peptidase [Actinokineospora soli]|uniref:S8 family serine peptidase n=1 Tax=Actinokineospora soli TaxID=1048753 RepID=A0ABW2TI29_9PSEU
MRHDRKTRRVAMAGLAAGACALAAVSVATPAVAQEATGAVRAAANPVPGSYIVVLKDRNANAPTVNNKAFDLAKQYGGEVKNTYTASVRGFAVQLDESAAARLAANPAVAYVEQDGYMSISDTQQNATWGIDRIDQRDLPVSTTYTYGNTASSVHAYVIDTGVDASHPDFEGRVSGGYDYVDNDSNPADCQGHGTHVAGTVGSKTWGVAKQVKLTGVRVLGCDGRGQWSWIISGIDWVAKNHTKPAVANLSLGGSGSTTVDDAVKRLIAAGVTTAVAAGNEGQDACNVSPARVPDAITVAASDKTDKRSVWNSTQSSNWGTCVDIWGPGSNILSTRNGGGSFENGGTSMATPHVAGAAALYLHANPNATHLQVRDALVNNSTSGKITDPKGSPNRLLYTGFIGGGGPGPGCAAGTNGDDVSIPDNGTAVSSSVSIANCTGNGSTTASVKVEITHSYVGDLVIDLVAPDGTSYNLKKAGGGKGTGGINETYTVDLSAEARNGTWKLQVADVWRYDSGTLTSWTLTP